VRTSGEVGDGASISRSLTAPEAFGPVFDRHFAAIHRYLARRIGRERADDLAAQTFTVAFERRAMFRLEADDARPWLYGIATKLLANERRNEQRSLRVLARLSGGLDDIGGAAGSDAVEVDAALAGALANLDPAQRDVLLLHAWGELSYEQIADALRIPVGTVRSRLSRARATLRAELETVATAVNQSMADGTQEAW
jgi:RNA polymerase sigma factor (sigma-70 family)